LARGQADSEHQRVQREQQPMRAGAQDRRNDCNDELLHAIDTCPASSVIGANPVVCTAPNDWSHPAGTCDPPPGSAVTRWANGPCVATGNACTHTDTCRTDPASARTPSTCQPHSDQSTRRRLRCRRPSSARTPPSTTAPTGITTATPASQTAVCEPASAPARIPSPHCLPTMPNDASLANPPTLTCSNPAKVKRRRVQ